MLAYYCRTALRSLRKNPFYAAISIIGLVTGLGAFVLLIDYTHKERTYDSTHVDGDRIYRVESYFVRSGQVTDSWASSTFGYAPAMKKEFPEIQDIVRVDNYDCERVVRYQERIYREPQVVFADSNFFRFFSYPLLRGKIDEVLREPNSIAISESAARKYFGHEDPIGKIMHVSTIKTKYDCAVTGIFKDFPANSTLQLDLMMSYMTSTPWEREFWYMHEAYTYLKAATPAAAASIEQKFPALAEKYKTLPPLKEHSWAVHLVPLADIHLNAVKPYEMETKGSPGTIDMLRVIAYGLQLLKGRNFSREYPLDKEECVILTENASQLFGFNTIDEALKGSVYLEGQKDKRFRIIGITKDYHQQSLKETYRPIVFTVFNPWHWIDNHYVSLKLDGGAPGQIVESVRQKFKDYFPQSSFDYFFLNDYFNRQYQQDIGYGRIILFFSILALCIVCLGIIGISGFMLLKRKKEIGIRKVSGAGTTQILQLLNIHFLKLVAIAFAVAVPVAWINMHHWLQNFASRVSMDPLVFLAAIGITSLVTILTVSLQSYKIASTRPADALRYE